MRELAGSKQAAVCQHHRLHHKVSRDQHGCLEDFEDGMLYFTNGIGYRHYHYSRHLQKKWLISWLGYNS
ncbi:hypothetical protein chiPu_0002107 [Chiloscyllium punctatum]|uniref:Uncharacterized protein n=1 Tax=Chiloscyllium punctatum TaxID=137246 RepID=A0A401S000_CHIPU|nr:hypothetical protein [Chiloscyllium punctatum]